MTTDPESPAYPKQYPDQPCLTKLELFAAMAMQGLVADMKATRAKTAKIAVEHAHALIAEINKKGTAP
jgi:hypothetical protein